MAVEAHSNRTWFDRALRALPGGVSSPVRAFRAVGGTPRFIARARGCRFEDMDNHEYTDFVLSWGAHLEFFRLILIIFITDYIHIILI